MKFIIILLIFLIDKNLLGDIREKIELEEELANIELKVIKGKMPSLIEGSFIKVGPAKFTSKKDKIDHWFDGLAMLYLFKIKNGKIFYTNKFINSDAYKNYKKNDEMRLRGFAYDKYKSVINDFFSFFFVNEDQAINNTNVNIEKMNNEYVALTEIPLPVIFDINNLETKGIFEFKDTLPKNLNFECAHPLKDKKGKIFNFLIKFGKNPAYIIYKMKGQERKMFGQINVKRPSYMHSFSMTENYFILTEYPFRINSLKLITSNKPFIKNFEWENSSTKFLIINKNTKEIIELETRAFFSFHHVNAYEKGNKIFLDLIEYKDSNIIDELADFPNSDTYNKLTRFEIDLVKEETRERNLEKNIEFPILDKKFYYGIDFKNNRKGHGIIKLNTNDNTSIRWYKENNYASEPVIVKNKENRSYILSIILDYEKDRSFLLILNEELKEEAILEIPHIIPFTLHGKFFEKN